MTRKYDILVAEDQMSAILFGQYVVATGDRTGDCYGCLAYDVDRTKVGCTLTDNDEADITDARLSASLCTRPRRKDGQSIVWMTPVAAMERRMEESDDDEP